jgi:hypothetical protein
VFTPSTSVGWGAAHTSDEAENPEKFSTYTWVFRTRKPVATVEAFYRERLPGATRHPDEGEDGVILIYPPRPDPEAPATEAYEVAIRVDEQTRQTPHSISESVFAERRP